MKSLILFVSLQVAATGFVLADEPATAPAGAEQSAPAATTASNTATDQKASGSQKPASLIAAEEADIKKVRAQGYKPQKRKDGTTYWCRNEATLGTRFEVQTCSTVEQILRRQKDAQEDVEKVQRQIGASPYPP
jgi:hypothetical protein